MMDEVWKLGGEPALVPARVPLRTEEDSALIIVYAVDFVAQLSRKIDTDLRSDKCPEEPVTSKVLAIDGLLLWVRKCQKNRRAHHNRQPRTARF